MMMRSRSEWQGGGRVEGGDDKDNDISDSTPDFVTLSAVCYDASQRHTPRFRQRRTQHMALDVRTDTRWQYKSCK